MLLWRKRRPAVTGLVDQRVFTYRVDAQNRILSANKDWFDFARENCAETLDPAAVIDEPIQKFISNEETKHIFDVLLEKVRATGETLVVPYRCDSPECRRFMELELVPKPKDEVEFRSRIVRQEFRAPVRLLESVEHNDEFLTMCGWCKKIALTEDCWVEVEEAIEALKLFAETRLPKISHSICPACKTALLVKESPQS